MPLQDIIGGLIGGGSNNSGNSTSGILDPVLDPATGNLDGLLGGDNTPVGDLVDGVDNLIDNLIGGGGGSSGGGSGGGGSSGGGSGGSNSGDGNLVVGNLINTRTLDGRINLELLNDDTVLNLSLLDQDDDGDGRVDLSLLDPDGDGLIDIGLLDDNIDVSILDPDGNGLIDADILDLIDVDVDGPGGGDNGGDVDGGDGPGNGGPGGSTDSGDYARVQIGTDDRDYFLITSEETFADGRGNLDTASYGVDSEGYTYRTTENGVFIGNGEKVDYLQDVERVAFSDGTLVLDTDIGENAGMAYRIYQAAFDRMPDIAGLKYWINEIDNGKTIEQVAEGFLWSNEFRQTYGTDLTNDQFVDGLYQNILNRDGETAGVNYWLNELDSGAQDRAKVLASFSESPENVALVGQWIDEGFFIA